MIYFLYCFDKDLLWFRGQQQLRNPGVFSRVVVVQQQTVSSLLSHARTWNSVLTPFENDFLLAMSTVGCAGIFSLFHCVESSVILKNSSYGGNILPNGTLSLNYVTQFARDPAPFQTRSVIGE